MIRISTSEVATTMNGGRGENERRRSFAEGDRAGARHSRLAGELMVEHPIVAWWFLWQCEFICVEILWPQLTILEWSCEAIILDVYIFPITCKVPGGEQIWIQKKWSKLMVHELPGLALIAEIKTRNSPPYLIQTSKRKWLGILRNFCWSLSSAVQSLTVHRNQVVHHGLPWQQAFKVALLFL